MAKLILMIWVNMEARMVPPISKYSRQPVHSHGLANKLYVLIEIYLVIVNTKCHLQVNLVVLLSNMF